MKPLPSFLLRFLKVSSFLPVLLCLTGLSILPSCESAKSSASSKMLRFNFEKGKSYDYEITQQTEQDIMGEKTKSDMTIYYSMEVKEETGNEKLISVTIERLKMSSDGARAMSVELDTDNAPAKDEEKDETKLVSNIMSKMFSALKGKQFSVKIDAEGKITETKGFEEISSSIFASLDSTGQTYERALKDGLKLSFKDKFNDDNTSDQFEGVFNIFPNKEVKVGDSWEKNKTASGPMSSQVHSVYTVKEIEGNMITLQESSTTTASNFGVESTGKTEGTIIVDSQWGLIVSSEQSMEFKTSAKGQPAYISKGIVKVKGKAN